jgi:hypothetical protein
MHEISIHFFVVRKAHVCKKAGCFSTHLHTVKKAVNGVFTEKRKEKQFSITLTTLHPVHGFFSSLLF